MSEQQFQYFQKNKAVMACGHVSDSLHTEEDDSKAPVCSKCWQSNRAKAKEVVSLKGRTAVCPHCGNMALSSPDLFDFFYTGLSTDSYYDGCLG